MGGDEIKGCLEKSFNFLTLFCLRNLIFVEDVSLYCDMNIPSVTLEFRDMLKQDDSLKCEGNPFGHLMVLITFYQSKIFYTYGDTEIWIEDRDLVNHVYNLMSRMQVSWMHFMLYALFKNVRHSLKDLAKEALYVYHKGNSLMRYHVETGQDIAYQIWQMGRIFTGDEVKDNFLKKFKGKSLLKPHSLIDPSNLYSYSLPLHGKDSLLYRPEILGHLLLIEAVLHENHMWEEIYPDCYHCQVEKFDFFLFRESYFEVVEYYIFFDQSVWNWMIPPQVTLPTDPCMNMYIDMHQFEVDWRYQFLDDFLKPNFFAHHPMVVKRLSQLSRFACITNVVMARMEILNRLGLRPCAEPYPERNKEHNYQYMLKMVPVLVYMRVKFETYCNKDQYMFRGRFGHLPRVSTELCEDILRKGLELPIVQHISMLRLNTSFIEKYIKKIKTIIYWSVL